MLKQSPNFEVLLHITLFFIRKLFKAISILTFTASLEKIIGVVMIVFKIKKELFFLHLNEEILPNICKRYGIQMLRSHFLKFVLSPALTILRPIPKYQTFVRWLGETCLITSFNLGQGSQLSQISSTALSHAQTASISVHKGSLVSCLVVTV